MFIKFTIICFLFPLIFGQVKKLDFKPLFKKQKTKPKTSNLLEHPYLAIAGIEITEELEDYDGPTPLKWAVRYNEKQTDFITELIIIQNEK